MADDGFEIERALLEALIGPPAKPTLVPVTTMPFAMEWGDRPNSYDSHGHIIAYGHFSRNRANERTLLTVDGEDKGWVFLYATPRGSRLAYWPPVEFGELSPS